MTSVLSELGSRLIPREDVFGKLWIKVNQLALIIRASDVLYANSRSKQLISTFKLLDEIRFCNRFIDALSSFYYISLLCFTKDSSRHLSCPQILPYLSLDN